MFRCKRVYLPPESEDGARVLVDRLWPRGLAKADAALDDWLKDVAPSTELRKWFHGAPGRWSEFRERYRAELRAPERRAALARLRELERTVGTVTLLYGVRDDRRNHAQLLLEVLQSSG